MGEGFLLGGDGIPSELTLPSFHGMAEANGLLSGQTAYAGLMVAVMSYWAGLALQTMDVTEEVSHDVQQLLDFAIAVSIGAIATEQIAVNLQSNNVTLADIANQIAQNTAQQMSARLGINFPAEALMAQALASNDPAIANAALSASLTFQISNVGGAFGQAPGRGGFAFSGSPTGSVGLARGAVSALGGVFGGLTAADIAALGELGINTDLVGGTSGTGTGAAPSAGSSPGGDGQAP
jgi:hypothetical protein